MTDGRFLMSQPKCFVTGCCGRIGSSVANILFQSGYQVHGYDQCNCPLTLQTKLSSFTKGKIQDQETLLTAMQGSSIVVHLAACPDDADFESILLPSNIQGTAALLKTIETINIKASTKPQQSTPITRLIIASSGKLFAGYTGTYPITLTNAISPICAYGATKSFVESSAQVFSTDSVSGCTTVCLRFAWCPRTEQDMAAYRQIPITQPDEFLSPHDAATCVLAAIQSNNLPLYSNLFVQSLPSKNRVPRFDLSTTTNVLKWVPERTFPDNMDAIVQDRDKNMDLHLKDRCKTTPGSFQSSTSETKTTDATTLLTSSSSMMIPSSGECQNFSVRERVTPEEWNLRVQVAAAYQIFAMHPGWTHSIHTHITAKVPTENGTEELFLINP